ncbi:unnamed protein product [Fusarium fujikuroi]|nr:unnamed protein product [Fusarium fujikuroi]
MSNYEQIAKEAEMDLNTYQAKTGNARPQDVEGAGVNPHAENKFESAQVEFGDELSTNAGYNKRIPPSEGGIVDDKGRQARGQHYEGEGGPLDKLSRANDERGGYNDNDVVGANVKKTSGLGSADDLASKGQEAQRANVGRNPPGPGGSQFKGEDYYQPESVPDSISAEGNIAPESADTRVLIVAAMSGISPSASGLLPMPGAPSSSWAAYKARAAAIMGHHDTKVIVAFWLFGLINNVLYVIILSAAQDLVGSIPKGVVLLADVVPSFLTKLIAPYFIHRIPYRMRVLIFIALSVVGMLMVALTPHTQSVAIKLVGVVLASISAGGGELSFLGLTHFYGPMSLAGWGSGTGAAGLVGAGLYVMFTDWWGLSVRSSLLISACFPAIMFISFFVILPLGPLREGSTRKDYDAIPDLEDEDVNHMDQGTASSALLAPGPSVASTAYSAHSTQDTFVPYMLPLLLVYVAEYTINQGVAPTLLFPLDESPFDEFRDFYPMYGFLYQLGVFISRSSTPFVRIHHLYLPSMLQVANLVLLTFHAVYFFLPSVYIVFIIIFWEGLLGGGVYVNCFAEIMENVPPEDREFSLGATTVSDSGGISIAGLVSIVMETKLCNYQVAHGRDWCRRISAQGH